MSIYVVLCAVWMIWITLYVILIRRTQHAAKDVFDAIGEAIDDIREKTGV
jgi:hypothetical protein